MILYCKEDPIRMQMNIELVSLTMVKISAQSHALTESIQYVIILGFLASEET